MENLQENLFPIQSHMAKGHLSQTQKLLILSDFQQANFEVSHG